jgi:hypothetical protein
MKKLIFAIALLVMGGASLSTASAASISPAAATIGQAAEADGALQLTGGRHHNRHRHYGYRHFNYGGGYGWYPYGYYDGYCYEHPYNWWCKKYFFKRY